MACSAGCQQDVLCFKTIMSTRNTSVEKDSCFKVDLLKQGHPSPSVKNFEQLQYLNFNPAVSFRDNLLVYSQRFCDRAT